ncbi:hypothetical protein [Caldivirga maquilingensis]|uniref:Uncharacterized protein n=1 Tax=Caldivirga maquilingensis (strain ATCC 700844 / DSM 13496 / JCM 10307 / IC-167) TaxID=397948 RepID=A8MDW3_CALMQ|nr:hypothetical protein [Caldivirga maquilingensis]ABW01969.1 hypothetical protein Cmaq_1142 [Caldivirga maquilingensis IC-167]
MSSKHAVNPGKEPFYFKSFDKVIGVAHNASELANEFKRLLGSNEEALEYHLREGHIVQWLRYIGEDELAGKLHGVTEPNKALEIISKHISRADSSEVEKANGPQTKPHRKPSAGGRRR